VFNASPVLKERAAMMELHENSAPYAQRSLDFIDRITDTLSKKMVRKVKNRWGVEIWPWDRDGFQRAPRCCGDWFRTNPQSYWVMLGINEERFG
jgi:hypothetical protein